MFNRIKRLIGLERSVASATDEDGQSSYLTREKVFVLAVSFILAFCLWFIVNLSRDHNITIQLPLELGNMPPDKALASDLPEFASVGVTGEGWKLISFYNNPPTISVDAFESEVNLFEKVQQQLMALPEMSVTKVQPAFLNLNLEERAVKRVPVEVVADISLMDQYDIINEPVVIPDSVTVEGAESRVSSIEKVTTKEIEVEGVKDDLEVILELVSPGSGVIVEPDAVHYRFKVAEFTEGEMKIPIRIRNLPPGRAVTYNPSSITVRYTVPIDQYAEVQSIRPFAVYVDYATIEADTTGLVIPEIEPATKNYDIRLRSFQPRTISYFNVVQNE